MNHKELMVICFEIAEEDRGLFLPELIKRAAEETRLYATRRGCSETILITEGVNRSMNRIIKEGARFLADSAFPAGDSEV